MKRSIFLVAIVSIAIASLVWAQAAPQATLRLPAGDHPVPAIRKGEQTLLAVDEVIAALGGSVAKDKNGYRVHLGSADAALAPDTRFATMKDQLIEMRALPVVFEDRMYVTPDFFDSLLRKGAAQQAAWDPASNTLSVSGSSSAAVDVTVSVVDLGDLSKVVLQFSAPVETTITREAARYVIQFGGAVKPPFAEQSYESPLVSRVAFAGNSAEINVGADVAGNPYRLENPSRLVIDLKRGVAPITPSTSGGPLKTTDVPGIHTIVIDAGHGGKDVGATGPTGLLEKETTLAICRKLANVLEKNLGARVILTRTDDTLIPLEQRTAIANQYKADLFLSVHLNASLQRVARGSETYFLSLEASDELARKAAEHENDAAIAQQNNAANNADLDLILWDLAQQDYMKESSRLAELVQEEMNRLNNIQNRGVKQAPFKVLVGATMPAALVEVGFISNPEEETKLRNDAYQMTIVNALAGAVGRYKNEYETRIGIAPTPAVAAAAAPPAAPAATPSPAPAPAVPGATTTNAAPKRAPGN